MAEYIERETLINDICEGMEPFTVGYVSRTIKRQPAADVAPVVHAQWIEDGSGIIICPECKRGYNLHAKYTHYCPNCGAMMDGGADHGAD